MSFSMPRATRCVLFVALTVIAAACADAKCPHGYNKDGDSCIRADAGQEVDAYTAAGDPVDAADAGADGASDASGVDVNDASPLSDASNAHAEGDASVEKDPGAEADAGEANEAGPSQSTPECDPSHSCAPGLMCSNAKCVPDVDECGGPNVCMSADYPCKQTLAPGYTCRGQFADWRMPDSTPGGKHSPSYDLNTTGVVRDNVTGLFWQRELPTNYKACTGGMSNSGESCTWSEAKGYCASLNLANHSDWRLPTKIELESILDLTVANPTINATAFPATPSVVFWSSSSVFASEGYAWRIHFGSGASFYSSTETSQHVRCVRGAPYERWSGFPQDRYVVAAAENTVSDSHTGLTWQLMSSSNTYDWESAQTICPSLGGGFRLPTVKELLTLVDPTRANPSADPKIPTFVDAGYWTVTPYLYESGRPMAVDFINGNSGGSQTTGMFHVRCVR